jgi:hypothetical protein
MAAGGASCSGAAGRQEWPAHWGGVSVGEIDDGCMMRTGEV